MSGLDEETEARGWADMVLPALRELEKALPSLPGEERAGVLLLANHILSMASSGWGHAAVSNPAAHPEEAWEILASLADSRDRALEGFRWSSQMPENRRHLLALDAAALAVGFPFVQPARSRLVLCWNTLHAARRHLGQALLRLRAWEERIGMPALPPGPDGLYPDDSKALETGGLYPQALLPPSARRPQ